MNDAKNRRVWNTAKLGLLILVTAVASIGLFAYLQEKSDRPERVILTTIRSTILGQERELIVHLPVDFDSSRKYPVAYVLDGSSQDDHLAEKFDVLSSAGVVPKVIVVGIPNMSGENRTLQLIPPFMRTDEQEGSPLGTGDKFLSFMRSELFPFIRSHYPASGSSLFFGHSRGAILVMYSLIYDSEMFQGRFCFSGPYWRQDSILVEKISTFLRAEDSLRSFLFLSVGTDEGEKGFGRMTQALKDHAPTGLTWFGERTEGADHQNNARRSAALAIRRWAEFVGNKK